MNEKIESYCKELESEFQLISDHRKKLLEPLIDFLTKKLETNCSINLIYVCTHNSRRSQFGQIWATLAAKFYHIPQIDCYSCGTEETNFNRNAISAIERIGFTIKQQTQGSNPIYFASYSNSSQPLTCFSKKFEHKSIPKTNLISVMTCSEAEDNCPYLPGTELRIATPYEDPKISDGTVHEESQYDFTCREIGREIFYTFSKIKFNL